MLAKTILLGNFEIELKSIKCPSCDDGMLILDVESIKKYQTAYSHKNHSSDEEFQSIYNRHFQCDNSNCKESAILTGTINATPCYAEGPDYGYIFPVYKYIINHIEPCIDLIKIPKSLPNNLKLELKKAFYIFWTDKNACANKMGIFIELLLEEKFGISRNSRFSLAKRINLLKNENNPIAEKLSAIRLIRNYGSHRDSNLSSEILVDAFDIIENVLHHIYDETEKLILEKVDKINMNKELN